MTDTNLVQDDLLNALGDLSRGDLSVERTARVRSRAHAVLARRRSSCVGAESTLFLVYHRVLEPALLTGLLATQLVWAAHRSLLLLYR